MLKLGTILEAALSKTAQVAPLKRRLNALKGIQRRKLRSSRALWYLATFMMGVASVARVRSGNMPREARIVRDRALSQLARERMEAKSDERIALLDSLRVPERKRPG